jgi:lysophospholipase L1-like esterase
MPALYPRTLPQERDSRWNFDLYKPDSVIINLGTNDFAPKNPPEKAFRDAYLGLVEMVREHYPNALIVCALGPLLSDTWPPKEKALSTARRYLRSIVTILHEAGDTNVAFLEFPAQDPKHGLGCDWHPSVKTHELMAQHLSAFLRRRLGWK